MPGTLASPQPQDLPETTRSLASRFIILALCLAIVLSTLAFGAVHSWALALFYAGACAVVLAWCVDAWRTRALRFSRNPLQLPLAGLFVLGVVQLLPLGANDPATASALSVPAIRSLSLDPYSTRFVLIQLASLLIYFAAALTFIDSPRRLRTVVRSIIIFGFALAILSMILSFVSPQRVMGIRETKQSLGFGPFINRHHFAGYMELTLGLPLGLLFSGAIERERRVLYILASALMGIAIILTNSRGGMLSLVFEIMFLVIVSGVRLKRGKGGQSEEKSSIRPLAKRAALGFAIVLALFFGVLFFGGEGALNRLVGTVSADDPTTGRIHFWRGTLGIIRDHPLIGAGLGSFSLAYTNYDRSNGVLFRLEQAHNDYLQLLSDAGIVGALLGLVFVALLFRFALRRMESRNLFRRGVALGALAGCSAVLVHSFFDFTLHTTANALLFLMLAALATIDGRVEQSPRQRYRHAPSPSSAAPNASAAARTPTQPDA